MRFKHHVVVERKHLPVRLEWLDHEHVDWFSVRIQSLISEICFQDSVLTPKFAHNSNVLLTKREIPNFETFDLPGLQNQAALVPRAPQEPR